MDALKDIPLSLSLRSVHHVGDLELYGLQLGDGRVEGHPLRRGARENEIGVESEKV
jgi:hypothetical protein